MRSKVLFAAAMALALAVAGITAPGAVKAAASTGLSGDEILAKVDGIMEAKATVMDVTMTTIGSNGTEKSSEMIVYTKKDAAGKSRTLIRYLSPAADKGIGFLSLGSVDQMWMYLPRVEKLVRIAGSMVKQSMMNSDFSYEDLMDRENFAEYYSAQVVGNENVDGQNCYVLELKAKKGSAHYRQVKLWVRQDNFIPAKEEFYSGSGKLIKVSYQTDLAVMDGRTVPTKIIFKDLEQKGHQTVLTIKNIRFSAEVPERTFSLQYLEKGQ
ncbi:MAG: outer membrane lipoprotein-sorting protein [Syntrophothermus sp.]